MLKARPSRACLSTRGVGTWRRAWPPPSAPDLRGACCGELCAEEESESARARKSPDRWPTPPRSQRSSRCLLALLRSRCSGLALLRHTRKLRHPMAAKMGGAWRHAKSWFPSHMGKAMGEMTERIKAVDVVIEVRDCRAPISSAARHRESCSANTACTQRRLVVLNKADLVTASITGAPPSLNLVADGHTAVRPTFECARRPRRRGDAGRGGRRGGGAGRRACGEQ